MATADVDSAALMSAEIEPREESISMTPGKPEEARARGEYWVEVTMRDANGKRFGGVSGVKPEELERILVEMARAAAAFAEGDAAIYEKGRQQEGFLRFADLPDDLRG